MEGYGRLEVINRDGWRRDYPLTKHIIHIGSDPHNDIVLDAVYGGGVAPRHLQLIPLPTGQGYRAVNLADSDLVLGAGGEQTVPPRSVVDIASGQQVTVGEFTVVVHGDGPVASPAGAGGYPTTIGINGHRTSQSIGVRLALPESRLSPDHPIAGAVVVTNKGEQTGAQFNIEVEGIDPTLYEIGPGPILFPGADRHVNFTISHPRSPMPKAGTHRILVHVSAPKAYPGERTTVSQDLIVLPYYSHRMSLRPETKQ